MSKRRLPQSFVCKGCEQTITLNPHAYDTRTRYCSRACKLRVYWQKHPERQRVYPRTAAFLARRAEQRQAGIQRKAERVRQTQAARLQVAINQSRRICQACGSEFSKPLRRPGIFRLCPPCAMRRRQELERLSKQSEQFRTARRIAKARRKAIIKGVDSHAIDPLTVFRLANWHCQSCGRETPKELRGKNVDDSPELDHIVPLARGGTHTWRNVQCLCRACNHSKGAKVNGQSILIGWASRAKVLTSGGLSSS